MSYNPSNQSPQYAVPPIPPGYQQPQQKKSNAGKWIIGVVILLLLIVGGIFAYNSYQQAQPTPQKTLDAFCDGWKTGNQQEMAEQLDPSAQKQLQVFAALLKAPPQQCAGSNVQVNGSTATATIASTHNVAGRIVSETTKVNLDLEQGAWKITSFSQPQIPL